MSFIKLVVMDDQIVSWLALFIFVLAVLHTFSAGFIKKYSKFLSQVEFVFLIWALILIFLVFLIKGFGSSWNYLKQLSYNEPLFVFFILLICSSKPILDLVYYLIDKLVSVLPGERMYVFFFVTLTLGPLLGSFITEPAAMTVVAILLSQRLFSKTQSFGLKYSTLGLLFVNVSIGGLLTPYAAPPVLMVAKKWNLDLNYMLLNLGWKSVLSLVLSTSLVIFVFRKDLKTIKADVTPRHPRSIGWSLLNLAFLILTVINVHHPYVIISLGILFIFLFKYLDKQHLKFHESWGVFCFLLGLVILGGMQGWWLEIMILQAREIYLYWGAIALTAVTDNAALTFLASQVSGLSDLAKYFIVSGSVIGGGLTLIANAPNPVGYEILKEEFGGVFSQSKLFLAALVPTLIAAIIFLIF